MKALFAFLLLTTSAFGHEAEPQIEYLTADSSVLDKKLDKDEVILYFNFPNANFYMGKVTYSLDQEENKEFSYSESMLQIKSTQGYHWVQFYHNENFYEVSTSLNVQGQHHHYFTVYFEESYDGMIMTEKPVIYLYPAEKMDMSVKVIPTGDFTFTYPEYKDGWNVTAHPDGSIYVDSNKYNYLFWESQEKLVDRFDNSGFIVAGSDVTPFLEEKLTEAGLNTREKTDFITFWAPRMIQYNNIFIQFLFTENCDQFASLDIQPKPDNIYRIYMLWHPKHGKDRINPVPQKIEKMDRSGFTVVEWGGQEIPAIKYPN